MLSWWCAELEATTYDPNRAVFARLATAAVKRLKRMIQILESGNFLERQRDLDPSVLPEAKEAAELGDELNEIFSWMFDRSLSDQDLDQHGKFLLDRGFSFTRAASIVMGVKKRAAGHRQPSKRTLATRALERKQLTGRSWQGLANDLCNCGARRHGKACSDRLRSQVRELEAVIKKFC